MPQPKIPIDRLRVCSDVSGRAWYPLGRMNDPDDIDDIEDYVAREQRGSESDATAPRAAGA